jgi:hypothetical protein
MTFDTCRADGSVLASGIESCDPFGEDCGNGESEALVDKANNVVGADGAVGEDLLPGDAHGATSPMVTAR